MSPPPVVLPSIREVFPGTQSDTRFVLFSPPILLVADLFTQCQTTTFAVFQPRKQLDTSVSQVSRVNNMSSHVLITAATGKDRQTEA